MIAFDAFAKALKATVLLVLLSLAWAMPAKAHLGHGSTSDLAVASLSLETASVCNLSRSEVSIPLGTAHRERALGWVCCGTMCTVALIALGVAPLPVRTPHGIRLSLPQEALSLERKPSQPARPPRTSGIA